MLPQVKVINRKSLNCYGAFFYKNASIQFRSVETIVMIEEKGF